MTKKLLLLTALISLFFTSICDAQQLSATRASESLAQITNKFKNPGKAFGSAPLWVWNTKVTTEIIDRMMTDFKKKGFGGAFIHPRPGLITEYLGTEWMSMYAHTIKKAKELDMNVWIYDENSYPTGFAGGLVPAQMPESYNQGQMLTLLTATEIPDNKADIFVCLKKKGEQYEDITSRMNSEVGKTGDYYLFKKQYFAKQAGMVGPPDFPLVDLMVKGVTEKFIEVTLEKYKRAFGNEFGKTIAGTFSDEPSIPAHGRYTVKWTPDLFEAFRERWGYDLVPNLVSLFEETGDWKKVRHNYQQVLLEMFIDRWSKPMHRFAEQNKLAWTGHYWEHGWPDPTEGPDNMAMYAWHQMPGIDMLFNQFNEESPNAQFGNIRSVKELSSVANQFNRERTLSETYGGAGWDLTFKEMKRLGDWEFALGVNFMNQHLSWMTMAGVRKYDYPPTFSYQNSWWEYYKPLNDYFTRLSYALSRGQQKNDILVIEPTSSAWMYYTHAKRSDDRFYEIGNKFQQFITRLQKSHVEFDLGSENIIQNHARVDGKKFEVGAAAYSTVVIPPGMENVNKAVFSLLKQFAQNGGNLVFLEKWQTVDGASDPSFSTFSSLGNNIIESDILEDSELERLFISDSFRVRLNVDQGKKGNLYHHRRMLGDGQLLFLSNADMEHPSSGEITVKGVQSVLQLDLATGNARPYAARKSGSAVTIDFDIPSAGSILLLFSNQQGAHSGQTVFTGKSVVPASQMTVNRPKENTLMIDFCDLKVRDQILPETHVWKASDLVFKEHGFSRNPWQHQMQFRQSFVERDTFSKGSGYTATYKFYVGEGVDSRNFRAAIEQKDLWSSIAVNGKKVRPLATDWWMDRKFGILRLEGLLRAGENEITLAVDPMSVYAEVGPVYILGDFNLESGTKSWNIIKPGLLKPGIWKEQGLPTYGNGIAYQKDISIIDSKKVFLLQLRGFKGTVAGVKVNGKEAGIIYSEPYSLDLTGLLKNGQNKIEVTVVGSLRNLLGPHYGTPRPGYMGPDSWSNIKEMIPGSQFNLFDYGLDDFDILILRK